MPRPNALALLLRTFLALLAVPLASGASCAVAAEALAAASPAAVPAQGGENALLADFVELPASRTMRRDAALVELVNMSALTLDVSFGPGSASLEPKQRMLAGVQPGDVAIKVTGRKVSAAPLEGDLHVEGGKHYELAFAYGPVSAGDAKSVLAPATGGTAPTPAAGDASDGVAIAAPPGPAPLPGAAAVPTRRERRRGEHVDVGRKKR